MIKRSVKQLVEAMHWKNGCLEMLNQRVLPTRFEYLTFSSATKAAEGGHPLYGGAWGFSNRLHCCLWCGVGSAEFTRYYT